ncbi:hypothetical protein SteCoe_35484 [Stentor coeruleus]|uniref:MORN repeat protein n=1 Tax=Stentor coeruleus TaxID=5963 RepID=A0A1R2ASE6_9CILI|nr:hypothetical protein SteCoe_35484 [Stentor coeruleus]
MGCCEALPENACSMERKNKKEYKVCYQGEDYLGQVKDGKRSGKGKLIIRDEIIYDGEWENDKISGQGTFTYDKNTIYKGQWCQGARHGQGEYISIYGTYIGNWVNDTMEGHGKIMLKHGYIYEGEFKENFISGIGYCQTPTGKMYFPINYLPIFPTFGRIFLPEGKELPSKTEKFDCLCITESWEIFEGWLKFGEKEFLVFIERDANSLDLSRNLIGKGILYYPDTSFIRGFSDNFSFFNGYVHSYTYDKETYKGHFYGCRSGYGICEYKDGRIYKGLWENGQYLFGTMKYTNGEVFKGIWCDNERSSGEMKFNNGETFNGTFTGIYKNYCFCQGVYTYLNGDVYKGSLLNFKKNKNGIMFYADGSTYKGNWLEDERNGFGVFTLKTGWYYQGEWRIGKMDGIGLTSDNPSKYFYYKNNEKKSAFSPPDEVSYEGEYIEGTLKHGYGTYTYANGDKYIGYWENDKRQGNGEMIWATGQNYKGQWDNDEIKGEGTLKMTDGAIYSGNFDGIQNFKGTYNSPDGNSYIDEEMNYSYNNGIFYHGTLKDSLWHGQGFLKYPSGLNYKGNFENGLYHGNGKESYGKANYEGEWDKGLKHGKGIYMDKYRNCFNGTWNMGKKHGEFEILFVTKEKFIITFENDTPVGKGKLYLNDMNDFSQEVVDELIGSTYKRIIHVEWNSEEIQKIIKGAKKYRLSGKPKTEEN